MAFSCLSRPSFPPRSVSGLKDNPTDNSVKGLQCNRWLNATAVADRQHDVYPEQLSIGVATTFLQRYYKLTLTYFNLLGYHTDLYPRASDLFGRVEYKYPWSQPGKIHPSKPTIGRITLANQLFSKRIHYLKKKTKMPAVYSKIFVWGLGLASLSTAAPLENTVPASEVSTQDKLQMNPACK